MNTKRAPFLAVLMICVLALSGCSQKQAADGEGVYVTSVAEMMGIGGGEMGVFQRYAGVVEAQQTVKINLESGRTVKERYVEIDDEVKEGDPIFLYDSDLDCLQVLFCGKLQETCLILCLNAAGHTLLGFTDGKLGTV